MYKFIFCSILALYVQSCFGEDTGNCSAAITSCLQIGINASSSNETSYKCSKYNETFQCLKNLTCVTPEYLRITYVNFADRLNNVPCDLKYDVYPNLSCPSKQRSCLFTYVDSLVELTKTTNNSLAVCLELSRYAECLIKTGCSNITQLESTVASEQTRAKISSTSPCIIPSLKSSLTYEECSSATSQCATLVNLRSNSSNICNKTQETSQCIVDLNCASDVMLRILNVQYNKNLSSSATTCDINSFYPFENANLTDCKMARKNCTYPYVSALLNTTNNSYCTELNTYITCLSKSTSCLTMEELKKMSDDEIMRMKLNTCTIRTFNSGTTLAWNWLPLAAALLYYHFFI
ncbi:hypothetical protein Btru_052399 [Bulinus truncatus]|nr:hypothetical protein Btru_052399 [Bulinus truncatus]